MKLMGIRTQVSKKTGNEYSAAVLDNNRIILVPDWIDGDEKFPIEVKVILKDFGKWYVSPAKL
jgi:hypothetical protein